jgi:hypothetical protein
MRNFMGVKSERTELKDYYERGLLNEAKLGLHDEETLFEEHAEKVSISGHTRRSRGRKKLPENLERRIVPHDISEEEKICSCGCRLESSCMAHARRKFEDVFKQGKDKTAEKVLYYMKKLYATEVKIRNQEYLKKGLIDKIVEIRQREAKPILEYLHGYLSEIRSGLPESVGVGRAIRYFLNEYPKLCKYLDNGYIYI